MKDDRYMLFYDGECPFCQFEVRNLQGKDIGQTINFVDISQSEFNAEKYGASLDDMMSRIHGKQADGQFDTGMEVFRHVYQAVGMGWMVQWTALPVLSNLFDCLYDRFAANRIPMGNTILKLKRMKGVRKLKRGVSDDR